ncbi:MAG TPA: GNAT family N-acetyltransferase [Gemmatimonadales bacterium]|nr:GNAT family N-acetyltransferase [Gemmatimonadales bacterium]
MSPADFHLRPAAPADAAPLAALGERTFRETFAAANRPEDLAAYLAATYGATRQAEELADPRRTTLVAATAAGELIAFAQLCAGAAPACVTGPAPLELLRFYVDRPWHGQGVAAALMRAVLAAAAERGARTLWLGVWERNPRAIAFYAKCGFRDVGSHEFLLGSDRQTDRIMTRPVAGDGPR